MQHIRQRDTSQTAAGTLEEFPARRNLPIM
jgi:hypothetical protein